MLNLLFDLDGTLVDSRETIHLSLNHTLRCLGFSEITPEQTASFVGAPLLDIFMTAFGMPREQAETAIDEYRDFYEKLGHNGTYVYENVAEVLAALRAEGHRLFIATVKPEPVARRVLEYQGFLQHFDGVSGSSMDSSRKYKVEIIAHALETFGLQQGLSIMIGDRHHDISGARENGLRSIGVSYGYGSRAELEQAGADHVLNAMNELPACVEAWRA